MNSKIQFFFIGGTRRGLGVIKSLLEKDHCPKFMFVLEEDDSEEIKHSKELLALGSQYKIPAFLRKKLNDDDYQLLMAERFDFGVICGWRTILDDQLGQVCESGLLAAHDSLLPKYRGFAPTNWAIINSETESGVTLFKISEGEVDSGPILFQKTIHISNDDDINDVMDQVEQVTIDFYLKLFQSYPDLQFTDQDESGATYTCKRKPDDGHINWHTSSAKVYDLIRALVPPYPCARCFYNGEVYAITKARIGTNNHKLFVGNIPGKIIARLADGSIEVLCSSGTIEIMEWRKVDSQNVELPAKVVRSITEVLK